VITFPGSPPSEMRMPIMSENVGVCSQLELPLSNREKREFNVWAGMCQVDFSND
jgi:hypothetical protein